MRLDAQDVAALDALRAAMETRTPAELLEACRVGDQETLDLVCQALPALRRSLGLTVGEFLGRDLAAEMGMARPVEH